MYIPAVSLSRRVLAPDPRLPFLPSCFCAYFPWYFLNAITPESDLVGSATVRIRVFRWCRRFEAMTSPRTSQRSQPLVSSLTFNFDRVRHCQGRCPRHRLLSQTPCRHPLPLFSRFAHVNSLMIYDKLRPQVPQCRYYGFPRDWNRP
jgi:hypothetical protein